MKKILFITSRNIISTCGELRLIKNRAKVLKDEYNYTTDFIAYRLRKKIQNEDIGGKLVVYRDPYDRRKLLTHTKNLVASEQYSCIILSGSTIFLAPTIKQVNKESKVIIDIHGTIEEYVEFRNKSIPEKMIFKTLYRYTMFAERKYIPYADGALAVSHPLADYYKKLAGKDDFKTFIVPCAVTSGVAFDDYQNNRKKYRKKYGLADSDKVFLYSGGVSPWQCVDETVELFKKIRSTLGDCCKLLIFSGSKELLERYKNESNIITDLLSPDEVTSTLCAGDFGIMLRRDYVTNNVAFPNKFLEYVGSGLRVIATPYVHDVKNYIEEYHIGFIIDIPIKDEEVKALCETMSRKYDMNRHFEQRDLLIEKCSFKQTLKAFDAYVGENK